MNKNKIKYMFNPEYLKKYVKYKMDLNKIDLKYNKKKQLVDESVNKVLPDKIANTIDAKLLSDRNQEVIKTSETFIEEVAPIEKDMNIKFNLIKRLVKEGMDRNGKV